VRLKAVEVWGIAALGTPASVTVIFGDTNNVGQYGDQQIHTDTSMGVEPAHVLARPKAKTGTALFQDGASANIAFVLVCPSGSVIDLMLEFVSNPALVNTASAALVAATPGAWYYRGLDGLAKAATNLPSVAPSGDTQ